MHAQYTHLLGEMIKVVPTMYTHRFAVARAEPPIDPIQNIRLASAEREDGVTTITFNRPRNSSDSNDISLNPPQCRFFLFAYNGIVRNFFPAPQVALYHGFSPTRRMASEERICIPTFAECSGKLRTILLFPLWNRVSIL